MSHPQNEKYNDNVRDELTQSWPGCSNPNYTFHVLDLLSLGKCQMCGKEWGKSKIDKLIDKNKLRK